MAASYLFRYISRICRETPREPILSQFCMSRAMAYVQPVISYFR